jgi:SulP family sulfate permease
MSALDHIAQGTRIIVLDMEDVPAMDATGLVNLESALDRLERDKVFVILAGVQPQPMRVLKKAGIAAEDGVLTFRESVEQGVELARDLREKAPPSTATPVPTAASG